MVDHAQRFGSITEVMYQCNECYTGGGSAICRNGQWDFKAECECEKSILEIAYSNNYSKQPQPKNIHKTNAVQSNANHPLADSMGYIQF